MSEEFKSIVLSDPSDHSHTNAEAEKKEEDVLSCHEDALVMRRWHQTIRRSYVDFLVSRSPDSRI